QPFRVDCVLVAPERDHANAGCVWRSGCKARRRRGGRAAEYGQSPPPHRTTHRVTTRAFGGGVKVKRSSGIVGLRCTFESVNSRTEPFSSVSSNRRTSESSASIHTF